MTGLGKGFAQGLVLVMIFAIGVSTRNHVTPWSLGLVLVLKVQGMPWFGLSFLNHVT